MYCTYTSVDKQNQNCLSSTVIIASVTVYVHTVQIVSHPGNDNPECLNVVSRGGLVFYLHPYKQDVKSNIRNNTVSVLKDSEIFY